MKERSVVVTVRQPLPVVRVQEVTPLRLSDPVDGDGKQHAVRRQGTDRTGCAAVREKEELVF